MTAADIAPRPLWHGRSLALIGILLVAVNMRAAVTALSSILGDVTRTIPFGGAGAGLIGALPPICFAVFGILTPALTRRASLELVLTIALVAITVGDVVRGLSTSFWMLVAGSVLTFAGMAVGNVLLPPLVKRYFPDRVGLMTSLYATVLAVSTLVPPLVVVPVAASIGWRYALAMWAVLGVVAALPWLGILVRSPSSRHVDAVIEEAEGAAAGRVWHTRLGWAMAITFAVSSLNAYAMFFWLPEVLHDVAGTNVTVSGYLLSLFAAMGIPGGLLMPILAMRMRDGVGRLVAVTCVFFVVGYLGLLLWPTHATWLWVSIAGLGGMLFPLCLALINLRTRTHEGSVALSGFTQGIGYIMGACGPLLFGVLHELTGGWVWPLIFLIITALVAAVSGSVVARSGVLEDQLAARAASAAAAEG